MEHRGFDIMVEYLPDRNLWCARGGRFGGIAASGETAAVAVAKLRSLIDDELAWNAVYPEYDEHARYPGMCLPNDVPGYSLEEALASVGPGWATLVSAAHRRLTLAGGGIVQVKEKLGGLRIYYRVPHDANGPHGATRAWSVLDRWMQWIEYTTLSTCEACGAAGEEVTRHGWMRTLCARCDWRWQEGAWRWPEIRGEIDLDRGEHGDG